jgi:chromosome partitioning protein
MRSGYKARGSPICGSHPIEFICARSSPGQLYVNDVRAHFVTGVSLADARSVGISQYAYARAEPGNDGVSMNTTLVVNAKGGVGKTTVTTNLASYFASRGVPTAIADFDPQGSSLNWIKQRPMSAGKVHGADLAHRNVAGLSAARREIPRDTRQLIIDAPAGPSRLLLQDLLTRTQSILIPVAPSSIDVHATANFIKELLLIGQVRLRSIQVAVVANRVRGARPVYEPLEKFIASLKMIFVARVSDSDVYVDAAEAGLGVFDMPADRCGAEQREFLPIVRWVQGDSVLDDYSASNVVPLKAVKEKS